MAGTIHGKVDVFDPAKVDGDIGSTMFKAVFDLLNSRTGSGEITRIAFNSGANAGTGNGEGFNDEPNHLGQNAFACYRFNTNSNRSFEWYLLMQFMTGSSTFGNSPGNPALLDGTSPAGGADANHIGFACAITLSGSSFGNPWNGTSNNDGNDSKGDPVWQSASADHDLLIFPRSNNSDGTHSTSRENMMEFFSETSTNERVKMHIAMDDQGIVFATDYFINSNYVISYLGGYDLRSDLTSSIKAPFCAFMRDTENNGIKFNHTDNAGTTNSSNPWEGGISSRNGVRLMSIRRYDFLTENVQNPNKQIATTKFDTFPVALVCTEAGEEGHLGFLPESLYQEAYNLYSESTSDDRKLAFLGDSDNKQSIKIAIPWNGQNDIGIGLSRTGSVFTR